MRSSLVPAAACGGRWFKVRVRQKGGTAQTLSALEDTRRNGNQLLKVENSSRASCDGSDATLNVLKLGLIFIEAGSDLHLSVQKRL